MTHARGLQSTFFQNRRWRRRHGVLLLLPERISANSFPTRLDAMLLEVLMTLSPYKMAHTRI